MPKRKSSTRYEVYQNGALIADTSAKEVALIIYDNTQKSSPNADLAIVEITRKVIKGKI